MRFKISLFFLYVWILLPIVSYSQHLDNQEEAQRLAKEEQKAILLVFSGSDWCQPCIRFETNVLQNNAFKRYAKDNLVILNCDFPQRKRQPKVLVKQNEALAEQFNPKGEFPTLLLLDEDLKPLGSLKYNSQSVEAFIKTIQAQLPQKVGEQKIELKEYRKRVGLMGSFFEFIVVEDSKKEAAAWQHIEACTQEAKRIEQLISEWKPNSDISKINQAAGKKNITVSQEVYELLERSLAVSTLTQGAFDLTFLPYYDYWKFDDTQRFPFDTTAIQKLSKLVDFQKVKLLDENQVFLPEGMKLGVGGIGQGYAVDCIKKMLLKRGVQNFVINSSGDVYAHGQRADGSPWKVGIASPLDKNTIVKWLPVSNFAVVTSGTSEKNFEYQGKVYGHIVNPKTGFLVEGLQSVTVMSEFTEVADALATSILILGTEIGLDLINQMPQTHCIIIDAAQEVHYSKDLEFKK